MRRMLKKLLISSRGSILMEFLLVAPVYLVLLGGLFSVNELVLLDNHVAVTDRNLSYDENLTERNLKESVWGTDSTGFTVRGQTAVEYNVFRLYASGTQGGTGSGNVKFFGSYLSSYVTVRNQRMPSMIEGMRNVFIVLSGGELDNYPTDIGALPDSAKNAAGNVICGRHFVLKRNPIGDTDRLAMYKIRRDDGGTDVHYIQAVDYCRDWNDIGSKEMIGPEAQKPSAGSGTASGSGNYQRVFDTFFSDLSKP